MDLPEGKPPALEALEELAASADIRDRAFVASVLSLHRDGEDRHASDAFYARVREAAGRHHAEVRRQIHDGTLDAGAFVSRVERAQLEVRDHLVEEVLDIAYPPRREGPPPREALLDCPSGIAEVLFMLEKAGLGPDKTFVDLGSGAGKVVLLAAMLTGARSHGIEIDPHLVDVAESAARMLRLDHATFARDDVRTAMLPAADVYYMYIPSLDSMAFVSRLETAAPGRRIVVFAQALNLTRLPWLRLVDPGRYWLQMYERAGA